MLDPQITDDLRTEIRQRIASEQNILQHMRDQVRPLRAKTQRIHPRSATSISLVGTDGGNNQIAYDPFMVQLIRVVDSSQNELWLETVTPTTSTKELNKRHLNADGTPKSVLGRMMKYLQVSGLEDLSPVFKKEGADRSPSWIQEYRGMVEWAILFSLVREKDYGSDVLIVRDGPLREKMFQSGLFRAFQQGLVEGIDEQFRKNRRRIYIAGIVKHSKFLQRYRLSMALEGVMRNRFPCFVEVDVNVAKDVYRWSEWLTGGGEKEGFAAGRMYLVKFGSGERDPIWVADIFEPQASAAPTIFGYLLADAIDGFPVPFYPQCLQKAHEGAALVDFDMDILQEGIMSALRDSLGANKWIIDELSLTDRDPTRTRY